MTVEFTTSKLNNFEEMLSNVSKMSDNKSLMLDKSSKNFEKIFDKSLQGVNEGVNKERIIANTKALLERKQIEVREAHKKVEILKKLKEKQEKEYYKEFLDAEIKEIDDITSARFNLK